MKSKRFISIRAEVCGLVVAAILSGCNSAPISQGDGTGPTKVGTQPTKGTSAPSAYWVSAEFTPFFRMGPQQPTGPDQSLKKQTRLTVQRRGFGFSEVTLEDGTTGWVGTDDIAPVPDNVMKEERDLMAFDSSGSRGGGGSRGRHSSRAIVEYPDADVEMPVPEDLILPDSDTVPVIKPEFRY